MPNHLESTILWKFRLKTENHTGRTIQIIEPPEAIPKVLENPKGLAKFAKKFGINMPPKDTYVFAGEKDAVSVNAAAKRLGITKDQLKTHDEAGLKAVHLERVPNYRDAFFNSHPGLIPVADRIVVHHSIPKWFLAKYPGLFSATELNCPEMLRGIYKGVNDQLHNSLIHESWGRFRFSHPLPTRQDVLYMVKSLDGKYGHLFAPVEGK